MTTNHLIQLTDHVRRITYCGMHVDLVDTSEGLVRVGSMPDIAKFMSRYALTEKFVVVPPWQASMAGDNYTGEEFVLWQAQARKEAARHYVGGSEDLDLLYNNLNETFAYYFDDRRLSIEKRDWIDNWFIKHPATPLYKSGGLEITIEDGNVVVADRGRRLYDRCECPATEPNRLIAEVLEKTPRDTEHRKKLEIQAIGTGNGFFETVSNCLVRFGKEVIWIDPCGYPAHALSRHAVHWDDVSHLLITHNHEDHVQGVSACLARARATGAPIQLVTAPAIHAALKKQFSPLFPDFSALVNLCPLLPGAPVTLGAIEVSCRWNHHFLPFGTLGLKFSAGGHSFGYSGDTKFDTDINAVIGRKELGPEWFADCSLVFHEVDFHNPSGVHTYWKQLQKLADAIPGQVLGYHTAGLSDPPFPLVKQGKIYFPG